MGKNNIDQIIKKTVKETVNEFQKARLIKNDGSTYFQKTEKLLYSYNDLLEAVKQKERDIEFLKKNGLQEKSKSVVFYGTGLGSSGAVDHYLETIESYEASKEKTQRLINKIDRALEVIKEDKYYNIIEFRYFKKLTNADMEEKFGITERTIRRHRKRLINKLEILLFGADVLV